MNAIKAEFSRVYSTYYEKLITMFSRKLNSYEDARDMTQEVFTTYYANLLKGTVMSNPAAWLYQASLYCYCNYQRTTWIRCVEYREPPEYIGESRERLRLGGDAFWVWDEIIQQMAEFPRETFILVGIFHCPFSFAAAELQMTEYRVTKYYHTACRMMISGLKKKGVSAPQELL